MTITSDIDAARLRTLVAELDRLIASPGPSAAVDPDGTPGHVAAGELIESAWGNAVVDDLDDLRQRFPAVQQINNAGTVATGPNTWTRFQIGTLALPKAGRIYDVLVTVSGQLWPGPTGGYCRVVGGWDGVMQAQGEAFATMAPTGTAWLTHTFYRRQGGGVTVSLDLFGLTQNAGNISICQASTVATIVTPSP
jgi:hypothetical protein